MLASTLTDTVRVLPSRWSRPGLGDETERGTMSSSRSIVSFPKAGVARLAPVAILSTCMLLAASSVAFAAASPWDPILKGLGKSVNAPFKAVYQLVGTTTTGTTTTTTQNESVTFAQDPSKKEVALVTPDGSFYLSATKILACREQAGKLSCYNVPESLASPMTSIKNLFAPGVIKSEIGSLQTEASAHGYKLTSFSKSYGWTGPGVSGSTTYSSNCVQVTGPKMYGVGIYCSSSSYGVLTYSHGSSSGGKSDTITIHAGGYTSNPPASTFAPPPGTPIVAIP